MFHRIVYACGLIFHMVVVKINRHVVDGKSGGQSYTETSLCRA